MHKLLDILEEKFKKTAANITEKAAANIFLQEDLNVFNALGKAIHYVECHQAKHHASPFKANDSAESGERQEYQSIREEIEGAQKYLKMWLDTGEVVYEKLALEEVGHTEELIGLLRKKNPPIPSDIKFANEATAAINTVKAKLTKPTK